MTDPGHPDTCPDTSPDTAPATGGHVRTPRVIGEHRDPCTLPTSTDAIRTPPDSCPPDTGTGVRFEYRARVPRHLAAAAIAEAFGYLADELGNTRAAPGPDPTPQN
ncbi:hypothetical protein ACFY0G_17445 [Streptomyces sp. NPDC001552]|uniref:hypothetical protein n=1 Tax=Streptomyces sp. NPDC001552 TaxID=3364587 RepID=UPI0036AAC1F1